MSYLTLNCAPDENVKTAGIPFSNVASFQRLREDGVTRVFLKQTESNLFGFDVENTPEDIILTLENPVPWHLR